MSLVRLDKEKKLFTISVGAEINKELIEEAIKLHRASLFRLYRENNDLYLSNHDILKQKAKEAYKPDNRLLVNYAKYIVDTFSGYQIGIPVKIKHDDDSVSDFVSAFRKSNDMEDSEYELSKIADIFGHAFIYLYQDEEAKTRMTYENPMNMLILHDDSVACRPVCAIRYNLDDVNKTGTGEVLTSDKVIPITLDGADLVFGEEQQHSFIDLPIVELIENEERQGLFDSVKTLINALNKALSEKANDVDYFADAYLKIIGHELEEDVANNIKDSRIINLYGDASNLDASFLDKPNSDSTQQNLIDLLIKHIFNISMVANLSDEDFGNSSGVALAFKLQPMSNMALIKDRKMQSAFNRMYKLIFNVPLAGVDSNAWEELKYTFTRNVPKNTLEEAQIAQTLSGIVSSETQLAVLSIVDDVQDEIDRLEKEEESASQLEKRIEQNRRFSDKDLGQEVMTDDDRIE